MSHSGSKTPAGRPWWDLGATGTRPGNPQNIYLDWEEVTMALSQELNACRAKEASAADRELALLVLIMPQLFALLTERQRRVLIMRANMEGASWPEVAAALGMSRAAAWGLWKRGIAKLPDTVPELEQAREQAMNPRLWEVAM